MLFPLTPEHACGSDEGGSVGLRRSDGALFIVARRSDRAVVDVRRYFAGVYLPVRRGEAFACLDAVRHLDTSGWAIVREDDGVTLAPVTGCS